MSAGAVIFDFDGVIVDTEPLHYRSFQRVLEPLGMHFSWEEYVQTYIGFDDRDAFREAFRAQGNGECYDLEELISRKALTFQDVIKDGVTPYPGVIDLIRKMAATGIPLAICSGALRSDIDPILAMFEIADCFDTIVTAEDVSASKPDPACYSLAYRKLMDVRQSTVSKQETIAIEDTCAGIQSASSAGLTVCAVTNSYPAEKLSAAHFCTDSLENLLNFRTDSH
ncbi:MAG TPA: HAD family phosphatase [Desulfuromonadales bacterium]|nr:HAD family phosphatase [Desulfuromonadales bacterium]